ncbi:MAG: Asp23/Gls24 family envelope stress response protein [Breznakia sp.]
MAITKNTKYGDIDVSIDAITALAGGIVSECYGVVGMASQKFLKDGWAELLGKENFSKGVYVKEKDGLLELDLYIIVSYGVRISEVVLEVQKKVKYMLEKTLDVDFDTINVFVQDIKVIK